MKPTEEQRAAARDLVIRARAKDQNAMATIAEVRVHAGNGDNPRAQAAYQALQEYILAHPVDAADVAVFHGEADVFEGDFARNVERVVDEARRGKSWALAYLANVRRRASGGYTRAKLLATIFTRHVKSHSMFSGELPRGATIDLSDPQTAFSVLPCAHGECVVVTVYACGPNLSNGRLASLCAAFQDETEREMFAYGVKHPDDPVMGWDLPNRAKACVLVGQCIGRARGMQGVGRGGAPFQVLGNDVAEEMGERS